MALPTRIYVAHVDDYGVLTVEEYDSEWNHPADQAEEFPEAIYFEVEKPATTREKVVALVADLARTLSDESQAWDIAVADFVVDVSNLPKEG